MKFEICQIGELNFSTFNGWGTTVTPAEWAEFTANAVFVTMADGKAIVLDSKPVQRGHFFKTCFLVARTGSVDFSTGNISIMPEEWIEETPGNAVFTPVNPVVEDIGNITMTPVPTQENNSQYFPGPYGAYGLPQGLLDVLSGDPEYFPGQYTWHHIAKNCWYTESAYSMYHATWEK